MLDNVEWGEFRLGDLFEVKTSKKRFDANKVKINDTNGYPYIVRQGSNNGQKGFIDENALYLNEANTISFGQDTATMYYQAYPYFTGDKIKILKSKSSKFRKENAQFFISVMERTFSSFAWGSSSFNVNIIEKQVLTLPKKNREPDFAFMENFINKLELERITKLKSYLTETGLNDYSLTSYEEKALEKFNNLTWSKFNLKDLFGEATRGKRLKSDDRTQGNLPFVTAGESEEGVSAFIGNSVETFSENTITIDMFGSAKYRNYKYGGDDHIAVVHTNKLPKYASIFITSAIHKASYTGEFHYGRNFYAKDADNLYISLPIKNEHPDYETMATLISAIHKLVIKDVVLYVDSKIDETKTAINKFLR